MNKQRKTSHILNVFQYDADGHVVLPASLTLTVPPAGNDNSAKVTTTAWVRTYVSGLSYITGNQSITVSGDATGSGTTSIALTLANTAVTPGSYGSTTLVPVVTVDSKGRITSVTTAAISGSLTFTGDVTGTGTTGTSTGLTLAASGVTAGTYTKVTVDSKGRVTVGASATTSDISEGTNLYYTDARVLSYLSANTYATQSYVNTQVSNLVASAPATLDTLNELAAALGNDPSFATTVSTSIGTKVPQTRTLTINGTGYDLSADRSWTINSMVYPGAGIALSTGTAWGTSITDNSANWNTAYGWGNHASGGYLTGITSSQVTTALGYTPYNSTNPSGYITSSSSISGNAGSVTYLMNRTDSGAYPVLWGANYTNSIGTIAYSCAAVTIQSSTGTLTATTFSGALSGNATTASSISGFNNPTTAATANTIVYRDSGGDIYGRYILGSYHNSSDNVDTGTITYIMAKFGDNYHRSATAAKVQSFLGLGSLAYSSATIPTNNNQLTNGAGYITGVTNISGNAGTATGQQSSTNFTINTGGAGYGLVGVYSPSVYQGLFAMGPAYVLGAGGTLGSLYGLAWTYDSAGYPLNTGYSIQHCLAVANAGTVYSLIGQGIWTSGLIRANGAISAGGTITASNFSGSSSGTNTGDQTNVTGYSNYVNRVANYTWNNSTLPTGYNSGIETSFVSSAQGWPNYGVVLSVMGRVPTDPGGNFQLYMGHGTNYGGLGLRVRSISQTNNLWTSWKILLDETNYSSYALPLSGGTMSGPIRRNSHSTGFLEGSYNTVGGNSNYTNPIYTIGSSYYPTDSSLQSMYGIGYSHPNFWGSGKTSGWGMYVCEGGTINATIGAGSTTIWAQNDIVAYSDARVKDNIKVVTNAIEKIQAIRGVTFTRTDADQKDRNKRHAGVIAQEVLKVLPEVVSGTEEDMYSVAYGNMAALFIEAIKEQQKQIEELQNKLDNVLSSR